MAWTIYDHVDVRGHNTIETWLDDLGARELAKVNAKIMALRQYGSELPATMLSDTDEPRISKLRVRGRINWRVLVCRGPIDIDREFTLLDAVKEKDNEMPTGATRRAAQLRQAVSAAPMTRRTPHDFKKYQP